MSDYRKDWNRMVERGVALLEAQGEKKSERQMRLDLAAIFGYPEGDLHCVMAAAGALYEERRTEPRAQAAA